MRFSKLIAALLVVFAWPSAKAIQLDAIGPVYPIGEESALTAIMNNLRKKERSGELKRLQQEALRRSIYNLKHLKRVEGIVTVQKRARRFIDPTVTYTQPVRDDKGRVVVPAGTKLNPLDVISLSKALVFFDGNDPEQCEAVGRWVANGHSKVKPILIAGSWFDLTKAWKTQVFYDQQGVLSKRFGITAVPAIIRQHGKRLVLEEIPAKELQ